MNIREKILTAGADDWLYLAEIASLVRQEMLQASDSDVIESTLDIIGELAGYELITIGDLSGPGGHYRPWGLSTAQSLDRLRTEWSALDEPINLGDICWLENTAAGDEEARRLSGIY
jgi:hypothetical protein